MFNRIIDLFNPMRSAGIRSHTVWLSIAISLLVCLLSEIYSIKVIKNPDAVGTYIILVNISTVIYFAFRDGLRGGLPPTVISVCYYLWVIITRKYTGDRMFAGLSLTVVLGLLYLALTLVVGYLRRRTDEAITHEREAKIELEKTLKREKEREQRKDDFMNMSSHELKTPITSISLYLDLLLKRLIKVNDQNLIDMVKNIKRQTVRLQKLTDELLDVSRASTGKMSFHMRKTRIDMLITDVIASLQNTTTHKLIYKSEENVIVRIDEVRIRQVLSNLINNAIKYSPDADKVFISLKVRNYYAIIAIRDFGIGVKREEMDKLFDKLYQVPGATSGLGIGLYLSKIIVEKHKGRIWIKPEQNGTTFLFSLPL